MNWLRRAILRWLEGRNSVPLAGSAFPNAWNAATGSYHHDLPALRNGQGCIVTRLRNGFLVTRHVPSKDIFDSVYCATHEDVATEILRASTMNKLTS